MLSHRLAQYQMLMVLVVDTLRLPEELSFTWAALAETLPKLHTESLRQNSKSSLRQQLSSPPSVMIRWVALF